MSRERLDRLMKKLPDGSYEVVGYELHKNSTIYHKSIRFDSFRCICSIYTFDKLNPHLGNYIPHDRIDQYTGVDVDRVKVFERDQGLLDGHVLGDTPVTVIYSPPSFKVRHEDGVLYELNEYFYKITGIEGVSSTNINTGE